ncbi:hypothetical protein HZS_5916 [Henneguya salminicola]|nr:hypothetical protein HZS_5916 [Henneguya salminicola]
MEKWAKRINDQTASKVIAKKQHIHQIHEKQKKTVELKDKIEAQELFNTLSSGPNKSLDNKDKILLEETIESDPHLSVHDLACLLCQRKFSSKDVLIKHVTSSNLHLPCILFAIPYIKLDYCLMYFSI